MSRMELMTGETVALPRQREVQREDYREILASHVRSVRAGGDGHAAFARLIVKLGVDKLQAGLQKARARATKKAVDQRELVWVAQRIQGLEEGIRSRLRQLPPDDPEVDLRIAGWQRATQEVTHELKAAVARTFSRTSASPGSGDGFDP